MSALSEPTPAAFANPVKRYLAATRPAFLSVTLVGCLLGLATAVFAGQPLAAPTALLTAILALLAHAAVNVLNDYFDHRNGTDLFNTQRVFPFTGGSRFIQNGVISAETTRRFGLLLFLAVIPGGLVLVLASGPGLLLIGALGLGVGWAYSAPPLQLASRGLGELAVAAGWLLVVLGADYVQRGAFAWQPLGAGLGFALLVANLLYLNQFPDVQADARAGKRTLVVRLGVGRARWGYLALALAAHTATLLAVLLGALPKLALWAELSLPVSLLAARVLWRHAANPPRLVPGIRLTILAALLHGLLLALCLVA
ncbi:1,4-dihydroxy-2-naphthoate octaprenyltransferase [Burkholderiales bacterium]|nr:1,4-dihydroxy-2-naphthoate octaprenyltransferase [Burkholderiales bacterium]